YQAAVEDQAHDRMIFFGGENTFGVFGGLNDVWVLANAGGIGGAPTWAQISPSGAAPSGRQAASAVYDPSGNRMIVFGGDPNRGFLFGATNDTWVLTNANGLGGAPAWSQLAPAGTAPSSRRDADAVYDPANNRMIVFGGSNTGQPQLNDTWVLENANGLGGTPQWVQLSPVGIGP